MAKFFIPRAHDDEEAERVWNATCASMKEQGFDVLPRRINSIRYTHNDSECYDCVGKPDRYGRETVLILLDADDTYLCCTAQRGVRTGAPILISKEGDPAVIEFDPK